jgi:hypothetical protein
VDRETLEYYERRARDEAAAAASASSAEVASAHRLLAIEYEAQARDLRSRLDYGDEDKLLAGQDKPASAKAAQGRRTKLSIRPTGSAEKG